MEPTTAEPSAELRERIAASLEAYRQKAFEINYGRLREAAGEAEAQYEPPTDDENEEYCERAYHINFYFFHGDDSETPKCLETAISDGLTIDQLLEPETAKRFLPFATEPAFQYKHTKERQDVQLRELEERVKTAALSGHDAPLPNEYRILIDLVSTIFTPGLPADFSCHGFGLYASPSSAEVWSLEQIVEEFGLEKDLGYESYAGFVFDVGGSNGKWRPSIAWVLCSRKAQDHKEEKVKGWRIFYSVLMCPTDEFDDLDELLDYMIDY